MNHNSFEISKSPIGNQILFWLGTFYIFVLLLVMTPMTNQLDDIKMIVVYGLGPIITVVYLILLIRGMIQPPQTAVLMTLLAYICVMSISMVLADPVNDLKSRQGMTMQLALLGPFLCFMGALDHKTMYRKVIYLILAVGVFILAGGYLHKGLPGGTSTATAVFENIEFNRSSDYRRLNYIKQISMDPGISETDRAYLRQDIEKLEHTNEMQLEGFWRRLFLTLDTATRHMLSFILNRNFLAGFLVFLIPAAVSALFLFKGVSGRYIAIVVCALSILTLMIDIFSKVFTNSIPLWFLEILALSGISGMVWRWASRRFHYGYLLASIAACYIIGITAIINLPSILIALLFGITAVVFFILIIDDIVIKNVTLCFFILLSILFLSGVGFKGTPYLTANDIKDIKSITTRINETDKIEDPILLKRVKRAFMPYEKKYLENSEKDENKKAIILKRLNEIINLREFTLSRDDIQISNSIVSMRTKNRYELENIFGSAINTQAPYLHGFWFMMLALTAGTSFLLSPLFSYRISCIFYLIAMLWMIVVTDSIVAQYALIEIEILAGLVIYLLAFKPTRSQLKKIIASIILIAIAGIGIILVFKGNMIFTHIINDFGLGIIQEKLNPIVSRKIIFAGAIDIWKHDPIFGAGPMCFVTYFPYFRSPDYFLFDISHVTLFAHNIFLDTLAETGILGFLAFVSFLLYLAAGTIRLMRKSKSLTQRLVLAAVALGTFMFLVSNLTSPNARWPICAGLIWAAFGMVAGLINSDISLTKENPGKFKNFTSGQGIYLMYGLVVIAGIFAVYSSWWSCRYFIAAVYSNSATKKVQYMRQYGMEYNNLAKTMGQIDTSTEHGKKLKNIFEYEINRVKTKYVNSREMAVNLYLKSAETSPYIYTALYRLGALQVEISNDVEGVNQARKTYETLQSFAPEFAEIRINLGRTYGILSRMIPLKDDNEMQSIIEDPYNIRKSEIKDYNHSWLIRNSIEHHRVGAKKTIQQESNRYYIDAMIKQIEAIPDMPMDKYNILDPVAISFRIAEKREKAIVHLISKMTEKDKQRFKQTYQSMQASAETKEKEFKNQHMQMRIVLAEIFRKISTQGDLYDEQAFENVELDEHVRFLLSLDLKGERLRKRNEILIDRIFKRNINRYPIKDAFDRNIGLHPSEEALREAGNDYRRWRDLLNNKIPVRKKWSNKERTLEEVVVDAAKIYVETLELAGWKEEAVFVTNEILDIIPGNADLLELRDNIHAKETEQPTEQ